MRSLLQVPDAPAGGEQQEGSHAAEAEERAMREAAEQRAREEAEEHVRRDSMQEMQVVEGDAREGELDRLRKCWANSLSSPTSICLVCALLLPPGGLALRFSVFGFRVSELG